MFNHNMFVPVSIKANPAHILAQKTGIFYVIFSKIGLKFLLLLLKPPYLLSQITYNCILSVKSHKIIALLWPVLK